MRLCDKWEVESATSEVRHLRWCQVRALESLLIGQKKDAVEELDPQALESQLKALKQQDRF